MQIPLGNLESGAKEVPAELDIFRFALGGGLTSRVAESSFRFALEDIMEERKSPPLKREMGVV